MSWYFEKGKESDVVVSTRIRFARNIAGLNFKTKISDKEEKEIVDKFKNAKIDELKLYKLSDIDDITKLSLGEKHILSKEILDNDNAAFLLNDDENISVMINEEDHIRIQVINAGLDFEKTYKTAKEVDDAISKVVQYAYNDKYGYLTTCPTNIGTGLRVSVMLHLPALRMTGRIQRVLDVVNKVNITVRGVYGEGTEAVGDMYQVSNNISLGVTDEEIIDNIKKIADTIIKQERDARQILKKRGIELEDKILRMYGTLLYAKKIDYNECAKLISYIKLGVDMGIIKDIDLEKVNEIRTLSKPAMLQKYYKKVFDDRERDIKRAELIKKILERK